MKYSIVCVYVGVSGKGVCCELCCSCFFLPFFLDRMTSCCCTVGGVSVNSQRSYSSQCDFFPDFSFLLLSFFSVFVWVKKCRFCVLLVLILRLPITACSFLGEWLQTKKKNNILVDAIGNVRCKVKLKFFLDKNNFLSNLFENAPSMMSCFIFWTSFLISLRISCFMASSSPEEVPPPPSPPPPPAADAPEERPPLNLRRRNMTRAYWVAFD